MNTAFGLAIAGAVFLGLGFLVIGAVILGGFDGRLETFEAIEHYHENVKSNSQDSSTRVMHFDIKGLTLLICPSYFIGGILSSKFQYR